MSHPNLKIARAGPLDMRARISRRLTGLWRFRGGGLIVNECNGYIAQDTGRSSQGGSVSITGEFTQLAATSAEYSGNVASTIAVWFKVANSTTGQYVFCTSNAGSANGYELIDGFNSTAGQLHVRVNSATQIGSATNVPLREICVAVTFDPSGNTNWWVNSFLQSTSASKPSGANTQPLSVNRRGTAGSGIGVVHRMMAYWDRILAPSEIGQISANPTALFKQRRRVYSIPAATGTATGHYYRYLLNRRRVHA